MVRRSFEVVVRPETESVVRSLRRSVHPRAFVAAKRAFFVVVRNNVLPEFRANRLQQISKVPDDREVAQNRMPPLQYVVDCNRDIGRIVEAPPFN